MSQQRDRSRSLTPEALAQLQQAIRAWEVQHEKKCTQERIRELTSEFKEGGLDPGTISKIRKGKEGVDAESIRHVFRAFGLQLQETDLVSSAQGIFQVDPNFVGREGAIADLNMLVNRDVKLIIIQARGGVGKTTLARKFLQQEFGQVLEFPIAKETKDIASIESLIEEKLRQLGEEPGREFLVSIDRLKRKLQAERIGILIDNLEPALDSAGRLIEAHRRYVELLRVLADPSVRSTTLITSRERLHEPSVAVQHYPLRSLEVAAWEQFFQLRQLAADTPALAALHHAYGGNAKAMEILSSVIKQDYSEDIEDYWQENQNDLLIERDLEDLVTQQFDRLQAQDEDAYKLLCRMGCYRYQDVSTVPIEGLFCLLWDVLENRQRRVVKVLQERSMVDVKDGEYWLHPVIRSEAIGRLKAREDWRTANCKAAEFWTENVKEVVTIQDALEAFEAYYHHIRIEDFEGAGEVIEKRRPSRWHVFDKGETLGGAFHRLGLLEQRISSISQIVFRIHSKLLLYRLYSQLGNAHRSVGSFYAAIECCKKSVEIAIECMNSNIGIRQSLEWTEAVSLLDIGSCKVDLWECEEAVHFFEEVIKKYPDSNIRPVSEYRLALVYSHLGFHDKALSFANKSYSEIVKFKLNAWARGSRLLSLGLTYKNLENVNKAFEMYAQAILYAEECNSPGVKGNALTGLAELYRIQQSFELAVLHHLESIDLLNMIEAKFDLAEAFYQLGLTYQAMEDEKRNESFQEAIRLFTEMEAPKQVERVRRSMENPK